MGVLIPVPKVMKRFQLLMHPEFQEDRQINVSKNRRNHSCTVRVTAITEKHCVVWVGPQQVMLGDSGARYVESSQAPWKHYETTGKGIAVLHIFRVDQSRDVADVICENLRRSIAEEKSLESVCSVSEKARSSSTGKQQRVLVIM